MTIAAMMAMSCVKENMPEIQDDGVYFTFDATRADLESKTVLVDGNKVEWVEGDKLGVFNGIGTVVGTVDADSKQFVDEKWQSSWQFNGQNAGAYGKFKANSASFDATVNKYLLVYPHQSSYYGCVSLDRMRFWLSANQTAIKGSFDPSYAFAVAKTNTLQTTAENPIVFENVCALLKFTVPPALDGQITKITVKGNSEEDDGLGGDILCDYSGGTPNIKLFYDVYGTKGHYTSMSLNSTNGMEAGDYYLAICPTTLHGVTVTASLKSGKTYERSTDKESTFNRGVIYNMGEITASNYNTQGIEQLPYAFSLTATSGVGGVNTPKYVRAVNGSYNAAEKCCDIFVYDDNTGAVLQCRQAGRSNSDVQTSAYYGMGNGADCIPSRSMVSSEFAEGYESYFKLSVPLSMQLPDSFGITLGLQLLEGAISKWIVKYSNDDQTWYDGGTFSHKNMAYTKYGVNITPTIDFNDMLYIKIVPSGTTLTGGTSAWGVNARLWGGIVITDLSEQPTTAVPSGAIFFEAFDKMVGGVDYLLGGQANGTDMLGGLSDFYGETIGSTNIWDPSATPTTWNNLTCAVVAMRPGYAQIGHTKTQQGMDWGSLDNVIGSIKTPKLAAGTLELTFKAMMYRSPLIGRAGTAPVDNVTADEIVVNVIGGGTFEDGTTTSKTISGVSYSAFQTQTLTIKGATDNTQIEFTSPSDVPSTRWFIDDICVKMAN